VTYTPAPTVVLTIDGATLAVTVTNPYGDTEVLGETVLPGAIPRTGGGLAVLDLGLLLLGLGSLLLVTTHLPRELRGRRLRHPHPARGARAV
jgi:hypothetical protein